MSQIALPLSLPADPADDAFVVGDANAVAVRQLDRWAAWPVMATLLIGPRKSGRSLLARIFVAKSGGRMIDDADRVGAEATLFHAWNVAQAERRPLLLVSEVAPPDWAIALPDLRSRLAATPVARIGQPDDALFASLLDRGFRRRGLDARPDLIAWLGTRLERNYVVIERVLDALDQEVMETRKRLSVPLARATLTAAGLLHVEDRIA